MRGLLLCGLLLCAAASARERMTVQLCNQGDIPPLLIEKAEREASYVFGAIDIDVQWTTCDATTSPEDELSEPDFIVRLRRGGHINKAGPTSLDLLGRAFMDSAGNGLIVDAYFGAIEELTLRYSAIDTYQILGCTIVHELGHLLIGPGHPSSGIMRTKWGRKEVDAVRHRWLKFNRSDQETILRKLRARHSVG